MLLEQRHELLVHVADHVGEDVDAGPQQRLGIGEVRGINRDTHLVLVRVVDDGGQEVKPGTLGTIGRSLLGGGWLTPPRDIARMHELMVEHGLAAMFDGSINGTEPNRRDDIGRVRERVAALLPSRTQTPS